jgi:hypothetical protein
MRVLMYTLGDDTVPQPPPTPELMMQMGAFIEEASKAGVLLMTGGLAPSSTATVVTRTNGEFTVTDGPFAETKEIIGGWAICEVRDTAEAVEWVKRFLDVAGDGESRIREVFGPE